MVDIMGEEAAGSEETEANANDERLLLPLLLLLLSQKSML